MRGRAMPKRCDQVVRAGLAHVRSRPARVIARATSLQREVRRGERDAHAAADQHHHHVRRARCARRGTRCGPVNAMPASLIDALVHRRGGHRVERALAAAVGGDFERAQHVARCWRDRACPATAGAASGTCRTSERAARPRPRRAGVEVDDAARRRASAPRAVRNELAVGDDHDARRQRRCARARTHRSGPMPAGSPAVTAIERSLMRDG